MTTRRTEALALVLAATALLARMASAGTPLPDPPFSSGGFVPPDSLVLKQELAIGKILTKYATSRTKCDYAAVLGLQLAYTPANPTKITELQAKWTACTQKAIDYYTVGRDKLLLKGTPACLDQAGIDAIRAQLDVQLPALGSLVFCEDGGASPDPVTGIDIPDQKQDADGEVAAVKVLLKAGTYASKCLVKGVGYAFKYGGTLDPATLAKIQACVTKASDAANDAMAFLDQTQKLPDCLPLVAAQGLVTATVDLAGQFSDDNYCASPSGAFVDGPTA